MAIKVKVADSDGAPHIPADIVVGAWNVGGVVQINLGVHDFHYPNDGGAEKIVIPTAHIRMTRETAAQLIRTVQRALDAEQEHKETEKERSH